MTDEHVGEWVTCIIDSDYQIFDQYPFPIRRKASDKVISEWLDGGGYVDCKLNRKTYLKHRIIAQQFLPNPDDLAQVDHINHDKTDNRLENLRWVSASENQKNKTSNKGRQYTFIDELPDTAEPIEFYGTHEFDDLWIDYGSQKLYVFNGVRYRELLEHRRQFHCYFTTYDREGKRVWLYHNKLFD